MTTPAITQKGEYRMIQTIATKGIQIRNDEDFQKAGELLKAIKSLRAEVDQAFDGIISKAWTAHKEAIAQKKKAEQPLVDAENILKPRIAAYLHEQKRKQREEEERLQREAEREAEERRLEEAGQLIEEGREEEAGILLEQPVEVTTSFLPAAKPASVEGVSMRPVYSAHVFDLRALLRGVLDNEVPIQAVEPNMVFLNQQARSLKDRLDYPGVELVTGSSVSARK